MAQVDSGIKDPPKKVKYQITDGPSEHILLLSLQFPPTGGEVPIHPVMFKIKEEDGAGEGVFDCYIVSLSHTNQPNLWIVYAKGVGISNGNFLFGTYLARLKAGDCTVYHKSIKPNLWRFFGLAVNALDM